jgi:hydrophobe/amphiphile efflux-1 (HAE1) family protein
LSDDVSHANDLPALSVRRPFLAAVVNLLIIIAGISAILGVEVRELPNVDRPIVSVRAFYPGASPETVDAEVTSVIEAAIARVNGVVSVRSSSEENNFRIRIEFSPAFDLIDAANDVREAVSRVERELPEGVEDVVVIKADNDAQAIMQIAVASDELVVEDVTRIVDDEIVPILSSIEGVAEVRLFGNRGRVLRVVLDPIRLAGYRLSITDVVGLLRNTHYDVPIGSFESGDQEILVRADASVIEPEEIKRLVIRQTIRLGDVADVYFAAADAESYVRLDGRTIVNLGIVRQAQSNTAAISDEVTRVVDELNARLRQVDITITTDDAVFIKGAIGEVLRSLGLAVLIVICVIGLFIGRLRATIIPAVTIPVALVGTVAAIWLLGYSINLVTLLALVLASGIVVDDSIVVLENIQRRRAEGIAARAAAVIGSRQVFFAVIATTATLVSVFLPMSFLPTTAGRLFREFGFVLAITVVISSFVALTLAPMIASRIPDLEKPGRFVELLGITALGRRLQAIYAWLLDYALAAPLVVLSICAATVFAAVVTYNSLGHELVPEEDRGVITVWLQGPDGVGLPYMDRQVERVEEILAPLADDGTISSIFTITGRFDFNRAYIDAPLLPWSQRDLSEADITRQLREAISSIPGARARISSPNSLNLRNSGNGLTFALTGPDYELLSEITDAFVQAAERDIPALTNMRIDYQATQPQLSIAVDRQRATDLGVAIEDLASTVQVLIGGDEITEMTVGDEAVPIMLEAMDGAVDEPSDVLSLYVSSSNGRLVPLSQLISFSEQGVAAELDRHGQRRAIEVNAEIADGFTLQEAVEALRELSETELEGTVGLLLLGEAATLDETSRDIAITYAIALIIVFLVLVAQFESVTSATVVLLTVPFGVCAAVFALAMTGITINIYSQIGVLMLIGIMAKNSILMVEFADQLRDQGADVRTAAREASIIRLRPIVMTILSTVLAGLPLILGSGPGIESRAAIGWVVFGGLGLAAVFTLFLTPVMYTLVAWIAKPRAEASARLSLEIRRAAETEAKLLPDS